MIEKRYEIESARIYRKSGTMSWNWEVITKLGTVWEGCTFFEWGARREVRKAMKWLEHLNIGIVEEYKLFDGGDQQ